MDSEQKTTEGMKIREKPQTPLTESTEAEDSSVAERLAELKGRFSRQESKPEAKGMEVGNPESVSKVTPADLDVVDEWIRASSRDKLKMCAVPIFKMLGSWLVIVHLLELILQMPYDANDVIIKKPTSFLMGIFLPPHFYEAIDVLIEFCDPTTLKYYKY